MTGIRTNDQHGGYVKVFLDKVVPLEDVREAVKDIDSNGMRGKVVLKIASA